jgi:hypothetical protein
LASGTHYRSTTDSKGHSSWIVDTVCNLPPEQSNPSSNTAIERQTLRFRGPQGIIWCHSSPGPRMARCPG